MKIILLQDVAKIGKKYEEKNVSDGYARNLLIPQGKALFASKENIKKIRSTKKDKEDKKLLDYSNFEKSLKILKDKKISVLVKANEKGHMFAGIDKEELSNILEKEGVYFNPENIILNKPIKDVGEHEIKVKLGDKDGFFKITLEQK